MANLNLFFWIRTDKSKWEILHKQAQELKDENPDKAIKLLKKAGELLQKKGEYPLSIQLEIVTVLYEHDRNDEAEKMLFDELVKARKLKVGRHEIKEAEKAKKVFQDPKYPGNHPDWSRNLHCKKIYSKFRIFYERIKQYEKAVPFAMAEAYSVYENELQVSYADHIEPDFKAVIRCLKRCNREAEMPELEKMFRRYAEKPDSEMCWEMLDELKGLFGA